MRTLARPDDLADVLRRLQSVNAASVARWGRMSAHQMICHLGDALRVATGEKVVTPRTGPAQRTVVKWIALYFPARWPAGIATPAEIDQYVAGTKPQGFARDVQELETRLRRFSDRCHERRGCAGRTFTPITTCGSLVRSCRGRTRSF
jgi:hypothetical protein